MMRIVTTAGQLRAALNLVAPVVSRAGAAPVLTCVLLNGATVTATDLTVEARAEFDASQADGAGVVQIQPLRRLLCTMDRGQVITLSRETHLVAVTLEHGRGRVVLPGIDVAEWPHMDFAYGGLSRQADEQLARAVARCLPFVSAEKTRYYLNTVLLAEGVAVATDGWRLAVEPTGFHCDGALATLLLPISAAQRVAALRGGVDVVAGEGGHVRFVVPGLTVTVKLVDAEYPNWRRVVPADPAPHLQVTLNVDETRRALARCTATASRHLPPAVCLLMSRHGVVMSVDQPGGAEELLRSASVHMRGIEGDEVGLVAVNSMLLDGVLRRWAPDRVVRIEQGNFARIDDREIVVGAPLVFRAASDSGNCRGLTVFMPMAGGVAIDRCEALRVVERCRGLVAA
ncbi:DNA polymerase III subunit beta family protein [Pannonibacter tanglangensis]|uniref:Beta sliding clamp n=1 Tax=Pannonibacter tanglangensis TaxID=2750084 RepID=A0ABW9ZH39_9HYPH|nr:hypothetical protein [Pannonibacter sp. XCT-34]NBN64160.1 hypothetical protein [Pannonibacter sp. XCT-34]